MTTPGSGAFQFQGPEFKSQTAQLIEYPRHQRLRGRALSEGAPDADFLDRLTR